jgi:hypothetical protein
MKTTIQKCKHLSLAVMILACGMTVIGCDTANKVDTADSTTGGSPINVAPIDHGII